MRKASNPQAERPSGGETRVYLLHGRALEVGPGNRVLYAAGYHSLPAEQAAEWIEQGLALPEAEYEAHRAAAQAAAQADPVMHPAGPQLPAVAPPGRMWGHGPKGLTEPVMGASPEPGSQPAGATASGAPPAVPAEQDPDVQTSATQED